MKQTIVLRGGALALTLSLVFGVALMPALAHDGEDHSDEGSKVKEMSITEMEKMIGLMQQLIVLLTTLRTMQPTVTIPVAVADEMEEHHDEHAVEHEDADTDEEEDEAKLVIEIEPHNNQTHAHVRYVNKPEEMFFVTSDINDEDGIVSDISSRTGLSQDEVREALKYMQ